MELVSGRLFTANSLRRSPADPAHGYLARLWVWAVQFIIISAIHHYWRKTMAKVQTTRSARKKEVPLEDGDRLDQRTFHQRYLAMPEHVRAELIGGTVFMSSPMKRRHGKNGSRLIHWLGEYELATPGVEGLDNTTQILGPKSEPQPDGCLFILPECGGQAWEDEDGYMNGAPEFIGEISLASESSDLSAKKDDYEKAGVREYLVVALRSQQVFWFVAPPRQVQGNGCRPGWHLAFEGFPWPVARSSRLFAPRRPTGARRASSRFGVRGACGFCGEAGQEIGLPTA